MSNIDLFLEDLTLEDLRSGNIKDNKKEAADLANKLSRLALDLAEVVQSYNRNGETVKVSPEERKMKFKVAANKLRNAMTEAENTENGDFHFDTKKWKHYKNLIAMDDLPPAGVAGDKEANNFAKDCVDFSHYIKVANYVPDTFPKSFGDEFKSHNHGEDFTANDKIDSLEALYQRKNELVNQFNEYVPEKDGKPNYQEKTFKLLKPSDQEKVKNIYKKIQELDNRIISAEKEHAKSLDAKAKNSEIRRNNILSGKDKNEGTVKNLITHSGSADSVAKAKATGIMDMKEHPIEGCNNVKKLVQHWAAMGKKPEKQIKVIANSLGGSGIWVFDIGGKMYKAPRNHFIRAGEGIARADSDYKDYVVNLAPLLKTDATANIAVNGGKITQQDAEKYRKFLNAIGAASVVTEEESNFFNY